MTEHKFGGRTLRVLYPNILRPLTPDELEDLRGSIRDRGIMVPVLVDDEDGLIDGGHRCAIAEELGLTDLPIRVVHGLTEEQKRALAVELNDCRRNQSGDEFQSRRRTRAEKRAVVAAALIKTPDMSDRAIAVHVEEETGEKVDHKTVGKVREQLGSSEQIPQLPRSKGRDGKTYPSRRKRKPDKGSKARPTRQQATTADTDDGNETPVDMLGRPLPPHLVPVFAEDRRYLRVQGAYAELVGSLRSLRGSARPSACLP